MFEITHTALKTSKSDEADKKLASTFLQRTSYSQKSLTLEIEAWATTRRRQSLFLTKQTGRACRQGDISVYHGIPLVSRLRSKYYGSVVNEIVHVNVAKREWSVCNTKQHGFVFISSPCYTATNATCLFAGKSIYTLQEILVTVITELLVFHWAVILQHFVIKLTAMKNNTLIWDAHAFWEILNTVQSLIFMYCINSKIHCHKAAYTAVCWVKTYSSLYLYKYLSDR
jgi:hypothetical protein